MPPYEYAFSFPSGHTLNSTVIAGVVAYLLLRRLRTTWARALTVVLACVWAVVMGLSRVFLGHHWLTDVVFAWLLGTAWLALIITAHRLFLTVRRAAPGCALSCRSPSWSPCAESRLRPELVEGRGTWASTAHGTAVTRRMLTSPAAVDGSTTRPPGSSRSHPRPPAAERPGAASPRAGRPVDG